MDLEVLIKSIQTVSGLTAKLDVQEGESTRGQPPWYKLDYSAVGIAFVLTVVLAMIGYSSGGFTENEIPILLVISYGLALGGKRLWRLISNRRRRVA